MTYVYSSKQLYENKNIAASKCNSLIHVLLLIAQQYINEQFVVQKSICNFNPILFKNDNFMYHGDYSHLNMGLLIGFGKLFPQNHLLFYSFYSQILSPLFFRKVAHYSQIILHSEHIVCSISCVQYKNDAYLDSFR